MKKILILLAIAVCSEWASKDLSFSKEAYSGIRKCEDQETVCYQTSLVQGLANSLFCFSKKIINSDVNE
jgi:hypothetical protein